MTVVVLTCAVGSNPDPAPLSDEQIYLINNDTSSTWKAGRNFDADQLKYVQSLLGVDIEKNAIYNRKHVNRTDSDIGQALVCLPESFDARDKWPHCPTIAEIRDQANCGSCWAFASVEAMSDRICAASGKTVHISALDVLSCCEFCGHGCSGGYPSGAWNFYTYRNHGIVTGGQYGTNEGCQPYSIPPCNHHVSGDLPNCTEPTTPTPQCVEQCAAGYQSTYTKDKHFGLIVYRILGVAGIMREVYSHGPVTAAFNVYSDFPSYKSGVYRHRHGSKLGGHAVKILGWGTESGQDYWLVANSWNTNWGDQGFFKIAKGHDECGIESYVVAGLPREK